MKTKIYDHEKYDVVLNGVVCTDYGDDESIVIKRKQQWYKIVNYPLRAQPTVIEFTTKEGTFCSTVYTPQMQEMVKELEEKGLVETEVSPFSIENFRELSL